MNFRTSTLLGAATVVFALASLPSSPAAAVGSLKLTGPEGETRVEVAQYGPTTTSDTFWSIAQKTRPDNSVTVYQMMAAIFEANPHAFASDNYNSLEKGMILAIPSKEVIKAIPASLAKSRAEQDDRSWQAMLRQEAAKPTPQQVIEAENAVDLKEARQELDQINESLTQAQSKNLNLTDELGRALDQLVVVKNDNDNLKAKIQDLSDRVATLEQELITSREQNQGLRQKVEQLEWEASQAALPKEEQAFITSPLGLGLISVGVTLLLLIGLWIVLKRKSSKAAQAGATQAAVAAGAGAVAATAAAEGLKDDVDDLAVHLDEPDDSIDSLLDAGNVDLEPETDLSGDGDPDMYVAEEDEPEPAPEPDESQSLDDLWAEAMGEQEEGEAQRDDEDVDIDNIESTSEPEGELEPDDDLAPVSDDVAAEGDDVDSLIADLESDLEPDIAPADDLMAVDSAEELSESEMADMPTQEGADEDDVDALLAGLDVDLPPEQEAAPEIEPAAEDSAQDALDAELDAAMAEMPDVDLPEEEADVDALLAGLDAEPEAEPEPQAEDQTEFEAEAEPAAEADETQDALDAELDAAMAEMPDVDQPEDEADVDALLAGLDAEPQPEPQAEDQTEFEAEAEPAAESDETQDALDAELDAAMAEMPDVDLPGDEADVDALLAGLDAEPQPEPQAEDQTEFEAEAEPAAETDETQDALDAELDAAIADMPDVDLPEEEADVDALLAGLDAEPQPEPQAEDQTEFEAEAEPVAETDETQDALDAELDAAMAEMPEDGADVDALLAGLETEPQTAPEIEPVTDAAQQELHSELDDALADIEGLDVDDADPEALLAGLQSDEDVEASAPEAAPEVIDEQDSELHQELDSALADIDGLDTEDADPEALLAGLQSDSEDEVEAQAQAVAAEDAGTDLDSLETDIQQAEPQDTDLQKAEAQSEETVDTPDAASEAVEAIDEQDSELDEELDSALADIDVQGTDEADPEALLAGLQSDAEVESLAPDTEEADIQESVGLELATAEEVGEPEPEFQSESVAEADDPLAELASLESRDSTADFGAEDFGSELSDGLDDDFLTDLDSSEGTTFSADDLDSLDENGQPIQRGVNPSVVPDMNQGELTNMTALERSEKAMDEAMSRSELRAKHREEALARARQAEAEEADVSPDELAEMASMAPSQAAASQASSDPFGADLSLDAHDTDMSLSDEELLAAFAENEEFSGESADSVGDVADVEVDEQALESTNNMTVEQALAALDAKEQEQATQQRPRTAHFDEADLANFQKENGFIDIDRLLNEADESDEVDNYQGPAEVAMEDYRKVVGDNTMVDVDDEENSVNAKLDLARAYIEIDDNDSARALLQEVTLDGNDRQQDEAKRLLEKIG